jgi:hypothetical protein
VTTTTGVDRLFRLALVVLAEVLTVRSLAAMHEQPCNDGRGGDDCKDGLVPRHRSGPSDSEACPYDQDYGDEGAGLVLGVHGTEYSTS